MTTVTPGRARAGLAAVRQAQRDAGAPVTARYRAHSGSREAQRRLKQQAKAIFRHGGGNSPTAQKQSAP